MRSSKGGVVLVAVLQFPEWGDKRARAFSF
jgi:hypothetical protein